MTLQYCFVCPSLYFLLRTPGERRLVCVWLFIFKVTEPQSLPKVIEDTKKHTHTR